MRVVEKVEFQEDKTEHPFAGAIKKEIRLVTAGLFFFVISEHAFEKPDAFCWESHYQESRLHQAKRHFPPGS